MQKQPYLTNAGQEVTFDDYNRGWSIAAHADDIAISLVTRIPATSGRLRAILPVRPHGFIDQSVGVVQSGVGSVIVDQFWAFLGPLQGSPTDPTDIRSAVFPGTTSLALTAQTAGVGTFRIDLIYATIFVDQDMAGEDRYTRDPITGATTPSNLPTRKQTYVTVTALAGVPGASPSAPSLPSDPPGGFNMPLARVRLPNGFGALSTVTNDMIMDTSTVVYGGIRPASSMRTPALFWDGTQKNKFFMGGSSVGEEKAMLVFDTSSGAFNGAQIDNSIDWRKRYVKVEGQLGAAGEEFPHHSATSSALPVTGGTTVGGLSHTFPISGADRTIYSFTNGGGTVGIYVEASTGVLRLAVTGTPAVSGFFWITASAQMVNT
jgi:hypothetical protein